MILHTLIIFVFSLVLTTALTTGRPPSAPHCEQEGRHYPIGSLVPSLQKCRVCKCYLSGGVGVVGCLRDEIFPQMCYNPVDNGPDACHRFTCPVRNCRTLSGHVLIDDEVKHFDDDGVCMCPPMPPTIGVPYRLANGLAICIHMQ